MHPAMKRYKRVQNPGQLQQYFREEFAPLPGAIRGFVAYYLVDAGGGTVFATGIFEHAAGALESIKGAAEWARQHPDVLPPATQFTAGEAIGHFRVEIPVQIP